MTFQLPDVPESDWNTYQTDEFGRRIDQRISGLQFEHDANTRITDLSRIGAWAESAVAEPPPIQVVGEGVSSLEQGGVGVTPLAPAAPPPPVVAPQVVSAPGLDYEVPRALPPGAALPPGPVPGGPLQDYARQAAQRSGIDPDIFQRQIQQESGFNPRAGSPAGAQGVAQIMPQFHPGVDTSDPYASLDYAANLMSNHLRAYGGDYSRALAAYNAGPGAVQKYGGVPPFEETQRYVKTILGDQGAPRPPSQPPALVPTPPADISQFGDPQLTNDEAYAACGPAAAVRFAQRFGRNPTLREATDLAKTVGWTASQGMAGLGSEKQLMDKLGVPTRLVAGADWGTFAEEAKTGNPVTISTRGHYFTADGYDPATNRFHVGRSGLDLRGGAEWMTPEQMTAIMGPVQGGLLADNPQVPSPSVAEQETNAASWLDRQRNALGESLGGIVAPVQQGLRRVIEPDDPQAQRLDQAIEVAGTQHVPDEPTYEIAHAAEPESLSPIDKVKSAFGEFVDFLGQGANAVVGPGQGPSEALAAPGMGYEVPRGAPEPPSTGEPLRQDVRDLGIADQPTIFDANAPGEFFSGLGTDVRRQQQEAQALNPYIAQAPGGGFSDPGMAITAGLERAGVPGHEEFGFATPKAQVGPLELGLEVGPRELAGFASGLLPSGSLPARAAKEIAEAAAPEIGEAAIRAARSRLPAEAEAGFAAGMPTGGKRPDLPISTPEGARATPIEEALDSGLILPGRETPSGPAQIYGPSGDVISTVAAREGPPAPGVGVVRTGLGAEILSEMTPEVQARLPNLSKMATDMPEVRATIQRVAEENPELIDAFRQGTITHQQLIEDLAPRVGMTADDFRKSAVGKAFNPEELLTLRAAVVSAQADAVRLAKEIEEAGGVSMLTPEKRVEAISQIVDAARLQAVGRGAAATAGRTLNQQKIVINETMARALTGANEAKAAQAAKTAAETRATRAQSAIERTEQLRTERQAARQAAAQEPDVVKRNSLLKQIDASYDDLERYQRMTLAEKEVVHQERLQARADMAARRAELLTEPEPVQELLRALRHELDSEQKHFGRSRDVWSDMGFWASKRGEILKGKGREGQTAWLEAERKAAQDEMRVAERRAEVAFNQGMRVAERQRQQAARILEAMGGDKATESMLKNFVDLQNSGDPLAVAKYLRGLGNTSWWDRATMLRYASMLSSTATHAVNALGNTMGVATDVALKPVAAGADIVAQRLGGGERTRYMAEFGPQVRGIGEGAVTGFKDAMTVLRTGIDPRQSAKLDQIRPGFNSGSAAVDLIAEAPLRFLQASDNLFRGAARGGHARALATRQAIREGYEGAAVGSRANDIVQNLTEYPQLLDEVEKNAARTVLQESRDLPILTGLSGQRGSPVARFAQSVLLPFVRTPTNIVAQGLGMTPAGVAGVMEAAARGDRGEAVDRVARAMFGSGLMAVAGYAGMNGFLTGARPEDESARSVLPEGWQPWSARIPTPDGGATYVSYQNLGQAGVPLALAAVMTEAARQGRPIDPAKVVAGFGRFTVDQTMLQGVSSFVKAIEQPERYAENLIEGLVAPSVPYGGQQRQIERAVGMADRDPHGAVEALMATFLPTAGQVAPRTTPLGEPVQPGQTGLGAYASPLRYDIEQDTPVLQALREADVGIPTVPKKMSARGGEVELTLQEQAQLKAERGDRLEQYVQAAIDEPAFKNLNREGRQKRLRQVVSNATQSIDNTFLNSLPADQFDKRVKPKEVVPYIVGAGV